MFVEKTIRLEEVAPELNTSFAYGHNKEQMKKVAEAAFISVIVLSMVGAWGFAVVGTPVVQSIDNLLPGSLFAHASSGMFLYIYFTQWHYPTISQWIGYLEELGITDAVAAAIATLLFEAGWITATVATGVLISTGAGIALAAGIVGF
ncbi:MAG: hypothetical protein ACYCSO_07920 [Cuniculiplasma sp.]